MNIDNCFDPDQWFYLSVTLERALAPLLAVHDKGAYVKVTKSVGHQRELFVRRNEIDVPISKQVVKLVEPS